ncbi:sugar-binding domain-containing protein [Paenibacillus sp. FSL W8-0426]|uniref:glycoside hydrolase family 2 protein n=1 Tax=Paenibacillus sp. FSL W8-0426 TaxID=2921714 RepID=UPI0030D8E66D
MTFLEVRTARQTMDLNGIWQFALDPDSGEQTPEQTLALPDLDWGEIQVPGSWEEQGYGEAPTYQRIDTWTKVREYEGAAWYSREVHIPADPGMHYVLRVHGVRWTTDLWINGQHAGLQESLVCKHAWDITSLVKQGTSNEVVLRVDNTMKYPLGGSHIHSLHTATAWGGVTGGIWLDAMPPYHIESLKADQDPERGTMALRGSLNLPHRQVFDELKLHVRVQHPDGTWLTEKVHDVTTDILKANDRAELAGSSVQLQPWELDLGREKKVALWSDVSPQLYKAIVRLQSGEQELDRVELNFGMRSFEASGTRFLLNGQPVFLRGYVDCCIFPLTGYPVWDKEQYISQFRTAKSYGFNHVRLHGWSAPEPFWQAADEEGMLVQAELPHWSRWFENREQAAPKDVLSFLKRELDGLLDALQKHPSFVLFSLGNELIGPNGHPELNELVEHARSMDSTRLYTDNTGFGQLPAQGRMADFYIQSLNWHPPLESEWSAVPDTTLDYRAVTRLSDRPVIGHEHAQFTMYVRPQEKGKYTGVLRPSWLEPIEESLSRQGMKGDILERYQQASGRHLVRSLKEAMERVRRTSDAAGLQLLDIRDFPGQGHATTGILDVFWESKGMIEPEEFRRCNAGTVLLLGCDQRTFFGGEAIQAQVSVSHYGTEPLQNVSVQWRLVRDGETISEGGWSCDDVACGSVRSLGTLNVNAPREGATGFCIEAEIRSTRGEVIAANVWHGWSFPRYQVHEQSHRIWNSISELQPYLLGAHEGKLDDLNGHHLLREDRTGLIITPSLTPNVLDVLVNGGSVWLQTNAEGLYDAVETKYLPVFWNYLMFATQHGATMGLCLPDRLPLLGRFPHDQASDWHWYHLIQGTPAICLDTLAGVQPLIEVIDHFHRAKRLAYAFEANVGKGKLLLSTFPFSDIAMMKRPEASFLFQEMLAYLLGDEFRPESSISAGQLLGLVKLQPIRFAL